MVDCKEKNRIKYDDFLKKEILIIYMLNLGKTNNQILPKILNFREIYLTNYLSNLDPFRISFNKVFIKQNTFTNCF